MKCLRNMDHMTDLLFICCKSCIDTVKPCLHLFPGSPKLLHFFRKAHAMIVFISCLCTQHSCQETDTPARPSLKALKLLP